MECPHCGRVIFPPSEEINLDGCLSFVVWSIILVALSIFWYWAKDFLIGTLG